MKKTNILGLILILVFSNCVDPPEYTDGLLENIPAIVNESDFFSINLLADKFSTEESYGLNMTLDSNSVLHTSLRINYSGTATDSSSITLLTASDTLLMSFFISGDGSLILEDSLRDWFAYPQKIDLKTNVFSGTLDYQIIKK